MEESKDFHSLAKDAGNQLRAYILSVASGGTGVFFVALSDQKPLDYSLLDKWLLIIALVGFLVTVVLSLYELRLDAKRFYASAKELEKEATDQDWKKVEHLKNKRLSIIYATYLTLSLAICSLGVYLGRVILIS